MRVSKRKRNRNAGINLLSESDCPTNEFKQGQPMGKCWGNGHYQCGNCMHYRKDFKILGQVYIDAIHNLQGQINITVIE